MDPHFAPPSRRDFLKFAGSSLAVLAGASLVSSSVLATPISNVTRVGGREFLLVCDGFGQGAEPGAYKHQDGAIRILEVSSGEVSEIEVPFFGHIATQNPNKPTHAVAFEKFGVDGALVDILDRKILMPIHAMDGQIFFGHSVFSDDGALLICPEENHAGTQGRLVIRSVADMKVVDTRDSYGVGAHECRSLNNGKTILVVYGGHGKASNMSWIDLSSGKLLRKIEFDKATRVSYSHIDISPDQWMCVGGLSHGESSNGFQLVQFVSPEGRVLTPTIPDSIAPKMILEGLSVAFLGQSGLAAVTVPKTKIVVVFDYKKQTVVDVLDVWAKGLLPTTSNGPSEAGMILSSPEGRKMFSAVEKLGQPVVIQKIDTTFGGNGSHMARIYI